MECLAIWDITSVKRSRRGRIFDALEYAFECYLPPLGGPAYYLEWGMPLTAQAHSLLTVKTIVGQWMLLARRTSVTEARESLSRRSLIKSLT